MTHVFGQLVLDLQPLLIREVSDSVKVLFQAQHTRAVITLILSFLLIQPRIFLHFLVISLLGPSVLVVACSR